MIGVLASVWWMLQWPLTIAGILALAGVLRSRS